MKKLTKFLVFAIFLVTSVAHASENFRFRVVNQGIPKIFSAFSASKNQTLTYSHLRFRLIAKDAIPYGIPVADFFLENRNLISYTLLPNEGEEASAPVEIFGMTRRTTGFYLLATASTDLNGYSEIINIQSLTIEDASSTLFSNENIILYLSGLGLDRETNKIAINISHYELEYFERSVKYFAVDQVLKALMFRPEYRP